MHLILLPAQEEIDCVSQYLRANSYLYSWIHRIGPKIFMKNITNYICLLILTTLLSSCLKGENINTLRVGIAFPSGDNSWWSTASYYAVTHASSLGQFYYMANADSTAQQQQQLTRMAYPTLTQEACKAIILSDMGQPTDSIQHYIDMGIGVILFNCDMPVDYLCRIAVDQQTAGTDVGNYIKNHLPGSATTTLILLPKDSPAAAQRAASCKAQLTTPTLEITCEESTQSAGQKAMQEVFASADSAQIGSVYAMDDDLAIGVLKAMEAAGETPVKTVVGCGGSQTFLLLINASEQLNLATTVNNPEAVKQCIEIANAFITTGATPAQNEYLTQMPLVDRSNAASYINPAARY